MIGQIQKRITEKRKNKESSDAEDAEKAEAEKVAAELAASEAEFKTVLDKALNKIGNIVHQTVPVSKDEVRFGARHPFWTFPWTVGLSTDSRAARSSDALHSNLGSLT